MQIIDLNKICYCRSPLQQYNNPGSNINDACRNCAELFANDSEYLYPCFNSQCLYHHFCMYSYAVCSQCYEESDNNEAIESTATDFIYKKFSNSLNKMSLVICHSIYSYMNCVETHAIPSCKQY